MSTQNKENEDMKFAEVVTALDADGKLGAARPSMRGYAFRKVEAGNEDREPQDGIGIVAPDGSVKTVEMLGEKSVASVPDGWTMSAAEFEAFVFADDWTTAPVEELEKARTGEGGM